MAVPGYIEQYDMPMPPVNNGLNLIHLHYEHMLDIPFFPDSLSQRGRSGTPERYLLAAGA